MLIEHLAAARPEWLWTWLARRPRWFHSPIVEGRGYRLVRPVHTWLGPTRGLAPFTVRSLRPSIVHIQEQIHSYFQSDAAILLARSTRVPVVTTLHEYHVELESVSHTTALVRISDVVIANDSRNAERSRTEAGREPDALLWSGNTVPPPEPDWGVRRRPGLVATFGFVNALKSLGWVFGAIESLRSSGDETLAWRVVGPFHPDSDAGHAELARTMSRPWVEFTGGAHARDRKLRTWLAEAEIMALPYADGASMRRTTLHAAWALGIPVVTTPPPHDEPAIVDGRNCLLVRTADPNAWADAIRAIRSDARLAERLRQGGLETADRYGWPELARRHLSLYDHLLAARSDGRSS
jgi:glycosyltransferase involved in cell wall biosynthesis